MKPGSHGSTFGGNPLAMSAGLAMLQALNRDRGVYDRLEKKSADLATGMSSVLDKTSIDYQINRLGSMISLHFTPEPVVDFTTAARGNNARFNAYFHGMLDRGIYLPPSAFESYFLNDALSQADIEKTLNALDELVPALEATNV